MVQAIEAVNSGNITTMTSLEIAKLTEKAHKQVLSDIDKMMGNLEISSADFSAEYKDSSGKSNRMYNLDKELTLTLVSGYNVKLRQAIIRKWQELEGGQKPRTYEVVMQEALILADQRVKELEEKILLDKPKVSFATAVEGSASSVKVEDWIKSVNPQLSRPMGRTKAFRWLREEGFLQNNNKPYQHFIDQKIFEVKQGMIITPQGSIQCFTTLITGKGQLYLLEKLK